MILDTNAISAMVRKEERLLESLGSVRRLAVTIISLGEYIYGIRASRYRQELELWLRGLLRSVDILIPDMSTVEHYANVRRELMDAGTPIPANDVWIAALARHHGLPILSLDRHFDLVERIRRIGW